MEQHRPSYATGSARSARPDPDLSQPAELTERAEHAEYPDLADLAELAELLEGRVTSTTGFRVVVFALVGSVVLGAGLLAGAAVSPSSGPSPDNARPAQVFWGCVFVLGTVAAGWLVGRSRCRVTAEGITRIWGAKKVVVPWSDVTGFAPLALKRSGLLVLRRRLSK